MQSIAGYMMRDNWLKAYQSYSGLAQILYQMDKRTDFRSQMQYAITSLQAEESLFEEEFLPFFTQLQEFVDKKSDGNSSMYSLEEFKERFDKNISNSYLDGRYGGIPNLSRIFSELDKD